MLSQGEVGFQPGPQPTKKTQDWSPINRMLAAKRGSSRTPTSKPQLMHCPSNLPRPVQTPPPGTPKTSVTCTQTVSWEVLKAEMIAHERVRADHLEREVKELKAQLKQGSTASKAAHAKELAEAAERVRTLELEVEALKQSIKESRAKATEGSEEAAASLEEERRLRREEQLQWAEEREKLQEEQRRWNSERDKLQSEASRANWLSQEADRRRDDLDSERDAHKATKAELKALAQERDRLLERLEVEQAEMMARVEKLEQRENRKNSLGSRSGT